MESGSEAMFSTIEHFIQHRAKLTFFFPQYVFLVHNLDDNHASMRV